MRRWRDRFARAFGLSYDHNGLRDYNASFGYPDQITPMDLYRMYLRNGIASRVIRAFPSSTWEEQPVIRDAKGDSAEETNQDGVANENYSPWVAEVEDFMETTQALRYLERADRLSSIGHYGILLMGFKDNKKLRDPLAGKAKLAYLAAYGEPAVSIIDYDRNEGSERYGKPTLYRVTPGQNSTTANAPNMGSFEVHYTRVIHISEYLDDNEVAGTPRLTPIYNHLLDLQKVVGSSAETFWRNSNPGIAFTSDADARLDPTSIASMKNQVQDYEDGMSRILAMQGVTPTVLSAQIADPAPNIEKILDLIAGGAGIPKRILVGSERGELASSQDADNWASRIDERQNNFASPVILVPFLQRMIDTGNLSEPDESFWVVWPKSNALSPKDQAEIADKRASALSKYASSANAELIVPIQEFRRDFLDLPPESEFEVIDETALDENDPEVVDQFGQPMLPAPDAVPADGVPDPAAPVVNRRRRIAVNATPRTLYIHRPLLNAEDVRKWYKDQGLDKLVPAEDMHVTICYSKTPVDWMKVGNDWTSNADGGLNLPEGGARLHELFGRDTKVLALLFSASSLSWRHEDTKNAGATFSFPTYEPHISLHWLSPLDLAAQREFIATLKPYTGELRFGPEVFEEVKEDWANTIKENSLARA